ncbi:hypothetical protein WISP_111220 [Willisornis vidua]|uniref:Reverse transcriptase domain-containing protein n=1 Tax=Willisornis vidua TaxID=1566151 RepID=A0ABQ9CVK5_9PASS|nr:hypothetical protein WISP_111220 [Willisornis vidua]
MIGHQMVASLKNICNLAKVSFILLISFQELSKYQLPHSIVILHCHKITSILLNKIWSTQLDKCIVQWVSNCLTGQAQEVTVNGVTLGWQSVTSRVLQGSILGPVVFNIFINNLDAELEGIMSKFVDDTKLGGAVDSLKEREALQGDLDKIEVWSITNCIMLNKNKC